MRRQSSHRDLGVGRYRIDSENNSEERILLAHGPTDRTVDHPVERNVGIGQGRHINLAHPSQELTERVSAAKERSQRDGPDEHTDDTVERRMRSSGGRGPDDHIGRTGDLAQCDRKAGVQHHEGCAVVRASDLVQRRMDR